jgi:hypothetical protein
VEGRAFPARARTMELPVSSDPEVLELLYETFDYLRGHPLELLGPDLDDAVKLGVLEAAELSGFVLGQQTARERPNANRFSFATAEENLSLTHYRLLQPVEAWPQPLLHILWDERRDEGTVMGTERVRVALRPIGIAQLWWGNEVGVIWEACFSRSHYNDSEVLLHALWEVCESFLQHHGVKRTLTYNRDPAFDDERYQTFLTARGYALDPARAALPGGRAAVVKGLADGD